MQLLACPSLSVLASGSEDHATAGPSLSPMRNNKHSMLVFIAGALKLKQILREISFTLSYLCSIICI